MTTDDLRAIVEVSAFARQLGLNDPHRVRTEFGAKVEWLIGLREIVVETGDNPRVWRCHVVDLESGEHQYIQTFLWPAVEGFLARWVPSEE